MIAFNFFIRLNTVFFNSVSQHFVFLRKRSDIFHFPGIPHLLASSVPQIISFRVPPGFLGLQHLCRLTRPVFNIPMFRQFCLRKIFGMSTSPKKSFLESVLSAKLSPAYREYTLSTYFLRQLHVTICVN